MISFGISHKGLVRKENQDAYINIDTAIGDLDNIYIVADGMGGHRGGEIASKLAVDYVLDGIKETQGSPETIIKYAIEKANKAIFDLSVKTSELFGMGTTLEVATIKDGVLYIGHIGDSRIYGYNSGELFKITKDHSYVQELLDAGAISEEEAYHHPNKNRITNALGVDKEISFDSIIQVINESMDGFLMCSDGLSNMIKEDEIHKIIMEQEKLMNSGKDMLNRAMDNGGTDNITLILVDRVRRAF